ncbi:MAG: hypothetical protein ABIQ44_04425 [Chloroflexia bacterium]
MSASEDTKKSKGKSSDPTYVEGVNTRKRRYTEGLGGAQGIERAVTLSMEEVAKGFARTLKVYTKRSERSARDKKDGALREGLQNWAVAVSKGMSTAGLAPITLVKSVGKNGRSKGLEKLVRKFLPPPLR